MDNILDKYRLELHWDSVSKGDGIFVFKNARFEGSGLKNSAKINNNDLIDLDLTEQHLIMIPDFYIARLAWKSVEYAFDKVYLGFCTLKSKNIGFVPKLRDDDFILINLYEHEEIRHPFNLVYCSIVKTADQCVYDFDNEVVK